MFMSKVEKGLLHDGFKAACNSSIAWVDLLLVERISPSVLFFCEILTVLFPFSRESNET